MLSSMERRPQRPWRPQRGLGALSDTGVISGIVVLYETDTLSGAGALDDP